eukprot:TRINITY_DN3612_c0_g1_i6.p1 TRINITY_DN3612_c0_g1~~TRINITY_DN3612_c0_g1_i6.p1  ORF type:complete len:233 (+),score=33.32 TRINITY_DN3612_c0_g1_i6:38-700(+)
MEKAMFGPISDDSYRELEFYNQDSPRGEYGNSSSDEDNTRVEYDKRLVMWNERFQTLMDALNESVESIETNSFEMVAYYTEVLSLAKDFVNVAQMYGKIIISERFLSNSEKTIQPSDSIGGLAGGSKYVKQGILFKFVCDDKGIYGGDDGASMKVGGHELKGMIAYQQAEVPELHLPLMALIDYRGFRVVAISMLPINKKLILSRWWHTIPKSSVSPKTS